MAKAALLVASADYQDLMLRKLRAPARDVAALARVLADPAIGGFDVCTLLNEASWTVSEEIEAFFADRKPDDLLLLYFSCHGIKDAGGRLYFAFTNTKFQRLAATGMQAGWVIERMDDSRSRRIVLLLDCCYSGAFTRGLARKGAEGVDVEEFGGRGRAVITASKAMEYAYEGDTLTTIDATEPSLFTRAVVQGLETGEADLDRDGRVDVNELYDYVRDRVREKTPSQTPTISAHGLEGRLYLARNPRPPAPVVEPVPLPFELRQDVESEFARRRIGAVIDLKRLLTSDRPGLALTARQALTALAGDDDPDVRHAATTALAGPPSAVTPPTIPAPRMRDPAPDPPSGTSQGMGRPSATARQGSPAPARTTGEDGGIPPEALAGPGIRSVSALIDFVIVVAFSLALADSLFGVSSDFSDILVLLSLVGLVYSTCLHGLAAGQTIANLFCTIRLISSATGGRVGYGRAFARWLVSLVSMGGVLGFGYLLVRRGQVQPWHDRVTGTSVVKTAFYPPRRRGRSPASG